MALQISSATIALYSRHARRFERWITGQARQPADPASWLAALQILAGHLTRKTWRLYRNAVTWHLAETRGAATRTAFLLASDTVEKPAERRRRLHKHVDPETLATVTKALRATKGRTGGHVADLMVSMVATGIRPNEWQSVVVANRARLQIANAKYRPPDDTTPGRGNGPFRELDLAASVAGTTTETMILDTIAWLKGRPWASVSPNANKLFRRTVAKLVSSGHLARPWSRLRIYDCRHQFSSDAKASLSLLSGEVAAAMGHSSAVTAIRHYGKRQNATGKTVVRPSPASIRAVSQQSIARAKEMLSRSAAAQDRRQAQAPTPTPDARQTRRATRQSEPGS